MRWAKKFWIVFLSFLPFSAGAIVPWLIGAAAIGIGTTGMAIYQNVVPYSMSDWLNYFSTCWTCQVFSDVMLSMSHILPGVYSSIGRVVIQVALVLTAIWLVWKLISGFLEARVEDPWNMTSIFSVHLLKIGLVSAMLLAPLPRMITDIAIQPIFSVGLSLNRTIAGPEDFDKCVISTALGDNVGQDERAAKSGAFSPWLRYNLACELASVHQMTGMGMTIGWTMMRMAFDIEYMHKILWVLPFFPNIPLLLAGFAIVVLYLFALLPIPLYFLEIFITLSMDLIMLPLVLLGWLFSDWSIIPKGGRDIRGIINDVVTGALGIAMTGIFVTFANMFLDASFGKWNGASVLRTAIDSNDSHFLIDGLMMHNDSLVTVILMGIFIAMFMTSIPALIKTLFSVNISQDFYNTARKNVTTMWSGIKKINKFLEK